MTALEFLTKHRDLRSIAERKRTEYMSARERAEAVPSSLSHSDMPRVRSKAAIEDRYLRLADAREAYVNAECDAISEMDDIAWFIYDILGIEGEVLSKRYVELKSWKQISEEMGMSESGIFKVHARALQIVQNKLHEGV